MNVVESKQELQLKSTPINTHRNGDARVFNQNPDHLVSKILPYAASLPVDSPSLFQWQHTCPSKLYMYMGKVQKTKCLYVIIDLECDVTCQ